MLEVTKFKLIDGGRSGITIEGKEKVQLNNNVIVVDQIKRTRKLILSDELISAIQQLKYYFFNCTGHWMEPFNKYYDLVNHKLTPLVYDEGNKIKAGQELLRNLWNKTEVTDITFTPTGFTIIGTIEAVDGKKTIIKTPFISEEDDLGFYSSAVEKIIECVDIIAKYFTINTIPKLNPSTVLSEEEMQGLSLEQISEKVLEKLADRDMIILVRDEPPALQENNDKKTKGKGKKKDKLSTSKKNIDSKNLPHADIESDIPEDETAQDREIRLNLARKNDPFGRPASEREFPGGVQQGSTVNEDISNLEHSENLGISTENDKQEGEKENWDE